jgi:hypothetical protein
MKEFNYQTDTWGQTETENFLNGGQRWHPFVLYEATYPDEYPSDWFSDEMFSFEFRGNEIGFEYMED